MPNGPDPASGTAGPSNDISVGEGLIELVFRNGFGVGGIESGGLIEPEVGERQSGAATRCGMGKTIDDTLASGGTVPGSLEPFEGEQRTGTVA
jgi:hypothetical protein